MIEIIAAIVGGALAIGGGFLAQERQNNQKTKSVARALLIELQSSISPQEYENSKNFYISLLDDLIETGIVERTGVLSDMLSAGSEQRYPIFYANAQSVGNLPEALCVQVVRFHSLSNALVSGGKILLGSGLSPQHVKSGAKELKEQYLELLKLRDETIQSLNAYTTGIPISIMKKKEE